MTRDAIQPTKVYKPKEAAEVLGVDKSVVYRAIEEDKLPKIKLGRGYKLLGEHLLAFAGSTVYHGESLKNPAVNTAGAATQETYTEPLK